MFTDTFEEAYYKDLYRATIQSGNKEKTDRVMREQFYRAATIVDYLRDKVAGIERVLDIGSSTGMLMQALLRELDISPYGVEPGQAFTKGSLFVVWPKLADIPASFEKSFNMITVIHTLEHIKLPVNFLLELRNKWISEQGYLLIEVPNFYTEYSLNTAHPVAFTEKTLSYALEVSGWRLVEMKLWKGNRESRKLKSNILALCKPSSRQLVSGRDFDGFVHFYGDMKPDRFAKARFLAGQAWCKMDDRRIRKAYETAI